MILAKVEYEFFNWEPPTPEAVELRRQLRLSFIDGADVFVSWSWERCHGPHDELYSIEQASQSFFSDAAAVVVEASSSRIWAPLVGQEISLHHHDATFQALEARAHTRSTVLRSLGLDRVFLSSEARS